MLSQRAGHYSKFINGLNRAAYPRRWFASMGSGIEYDPENDFYKVLGVTAQTDSKEIKKAYYKLAHKYHPDKAGEKHAEKFKQISAAWEVIGDPDSRKLYDSAKKSYSSGADYGYSAHKESYAHKHNHKK